MPTWIRPLTRRAWLHALLLGASALACGRTTEPQRPIAQVEVVPLAPIGSSVTVGFQERFTVHAYDASGALIENLPPIAWSSGDTAVATVDAAGWVVARRNGQATIYATIGTGPNRVVGAISFWVAVLV